MDEHGPTRSEAQQIEASLSRRRFLHGAATVTGAGLLAASSTGTAQAADNRGNAPAIAAPPPAAAVGYNSLTFSDDFDSLSTIELTTNNRPGYNWYTDSWFSGQPTNPAIINISNSVLTLGTGNLKSAVPLPTAPYYMGSVFSGGAYYEARIAWDPAVPATGGRGFWSMSIEHVYDMYHRQPNRTEDEQWPGQPTGYSHFAELDIVEPVYQATAYQGTIHDWSGMYRSGTSSGWDYNIANGNNITPFRLDWNQFHTFGCLWIPQNGSTPGYVRWFLDNTRWATAYWKGPIGAPPLPGQGEPGGGMTRFTADTPSEATKTWAIMDQHRFPIALLGNTASPMRVDWVRVWQ